MTKANNIKGYIVWSSAKCRWCDNFVPYEGNGIKICRLYEVGGQCVYKDKRKKKNECTKFEEVKP